MKPLSIIKSNNHPTLNALVAEYNQLLDNSEPHAEIHKLFLLQKINHLFIISTPDVELMQWYNMYGESSFEIHLQHYRIQRDGSIFVKSIQFSKAVSHYADHAEPLSNFDYFAALQARDALFDRDKLNITTTDLRHYMQYNRTIQHALTTDPVLIEKYRRNCHFLALCYAKMEAIKGVVNQEFSQFSTDRLGDSNTSFNNKNFLLSIEGENKSLVIRVEDRKSIGADQQLQTYPVSDYFAEDYYMVMMPFQVNNQIEFRPVALTEYFEQGSLKHYAASLIGRSENEINHTTQTLFLELSDFCLQLIASGHYHPDLKLSNLLTDGITIKIADRKTIINNPSPNGTEALSTASYAPPEYIQGLNRTKTAISPFKASRITLDMPSFMSYQMGLAMKEFMLTSLKITDVTLDAFRDWGAIAHLIPDPSETQKNYIALIQALTHDNPKHRLSIANTQRMLSKIDLSHTDFIHVLTTLAPQAEFSSVSSSPALTDIETSNTEAPSPQQTDNESLEESFDSGTFVRLGSPKSIHEEFVEDTGTFIQKPKTHYPNEFINDSGSVVKKTPEHTAQAILSDNALKKQILAGLREGNPISTTEEKSPTIPKNVSDIDTTIKRGGSGRFKA